MNNKNLRVYRLWWAPIPAHFSLYNLDAYICALYLGTFSQDTLFTWDLFMQQRLISHALIGDFNPVWSTHVCLAFPPGPVLIARPNIYRFLPCFKGWENEHKSQMTSMASSDFLILRQVTFMSILATEHTCGWALLCVWYCIIATSLVFSHSSQLRIELGWTDKMFTGVYHKITILCKNTLDFMVWCVFKLQMQIFQFYI